MWFALQTVARIVLQQDEVDIYQFPWSELNLTHILAIRGVLQEQYSISTANLYLAALRGVLKASWQLSLITRDELDRRLEFNWVEGTSLPSGRALDPDEIQALLSVCRQDRSFSGIRDLAIISVLYGTGMRRSELVALTWSDLHWDEAHGGAILTISAGKGNRARLAYLNPTAAGYLREYFDSIPQTNPVHSRIFIRTTSRQTLRSIGTQAVYDLLWRRSDEAGIDHVRPHDLRRTYITQLLSQGVDTFLVQQLAGHQSPNTTARYDRRSQSHLIEASNSLEMPNLIED